MPRKFRLCAHRKNEYRLKRCAFTQNPFVNPGPVASNSSTSSTEMTVSIPLNLYLEGCVQSVSHLRRRVSTSVDLPAGKSIV